MILTARHKFLMLGGAAMLALGGCTAAFLDTAAHGIFVQEDTNFAEKNYAAADYLIGQAGTYINRHYDIIRATPFGDQKQPAMESDIGKLIPQQVGVRFSQLGYMVDLQSVVTGEDVNYLKPPASISGKKPNFLLTGSYVRGRTDMDVSMRLVDARNARVVAAFDYTVPLTRQVNDMAAPQPKIMRMTPPAEQTPAQ